MIQLCKKTVEFPMVQKILQELNTQGAQKFSKMHTEFNKKKLFSAVHAGGLSHALNSAGFL